MLPINTTNHSPSWDFDGNFDAPTVSPSILTKTGNEPNLLVCHSFLKGGVFEYLGDCTHEFVNQQVPMLDLPEWVIRET
jgi:hypothetical protein